DGKQTFQPEQTEVTCTPLCRTAIWSDDTITPCTVYDDQSGTMVSGTQTCRNNNPNQYTYTKVQRTCVIKDTSGTNACIKNDGSVANIGDTENVLFPCASVPDCYLGHWSPCPPSITVSDNCGGSASDCGRVIPDTSNATCLIESSPGVFTVDVGATSCNPADDPGPCNRSCFNYPCTTYPTGYADFIALFGPFVEFYEDVTNKYLEPDFATVSYPINPNGVSTTIGSNIVSILSAGHPFLDGQQVDLAGLTATGGISALILNQTYIVANVTPISFQVQVSFNATSTALGGGVTGTAGYDQGARAMAPSPVFTSSGEVKTKFATTSALDRIRWRLIPSQNEAATEGFYLIGHLPYNAELGIADWNGSVITLNIAPNLSVGQTYDDVPGLQLFTLVGAGPAYRLDVYAPGPIVGPEVYVCGVTPCIRANNFTEPLAGNP
ncbi:MAG: hypothetical protein ACMG6E_09365, partial [Candidatus Roizmanbacteria bacterium]